MEAVTVAQIFNSEFVSHRCYMFLQVLHVSTSVGCHCDSTPLLPMSNGSSLNQISSEPEQTRKGSDAELQQQLRRSAQTRKLPELYGDPVLY